jgi:hypothetical protein
MAELPKDYAFGLLGFLFSANRVWNRKKKNGEFHEKTLFDDI